MVHIIDDLLKVHLQLRTRFEHASTFNTLSEEAFIHVHKTNRLQNPESQSE